MGTHRNSKSSKLIARSPWCRRRRNSHRLRCAVRHDRACRTSRLVRGASGFGSGNVSGNDAFAGNGNGNGNGNFNGNNNARPSRRSARQRQREPEHLGGEQHPQQPVEHGFLNPVIGGIAVNAGITAVIGGFSTAIAAPVTVLNGTNIGATALNASTTASANLGAAVGLGLGGSNVGLQVPVAIPINAQPP